MSLLLVLQQPMRMSHALAYAASRAELEKVILTGDPQGIVSGSLPPNTEIVVVREGEGLAPPSAALNRAVSQAERWAKGGSTLGSRVSRWVRSSEWRLRHADRLRLIIEHRRGTDGRLDQTAMANALKAITESHQIEEIVLFDLFDLPPALDFAEACQATVKIR